MKWYQSTSLSCIQTFKIYPRIISVKETSLQMSCPQQNEYREMALLPFAMPSTCSVKTQAEPVIMSTIDAVLYRCSN